MSKLEETLSSARLALTAELPAVDGGGVPEVERRLEPLREWVDAVNVTDNTAAHAHASPLAVSIAVLQCGVEPVMQLVGRDRNRRALRKADLGARFLQLQISFVPSHLDGFMEAAAAVGLSDRVALMPSISILRSSRALHFLNDRVPGVSVPASVISRVEEAADQERECFELACELAEHALSLPGVAGLHLISFRQDDAVARLC